MSIAADFVLEFIKTSKMIAFPDYYVPIDSYMVDASKT
jgi:hypothetical protein